MTKRVDAGMIQSFDQGARTVTLAGGQTYYLSPEVDATVWRAGDYVRISYDETRAVDGKLSRIADTVVKSSPDHPKGMGVDPLPAARAAAPLVPPGRPPLGGSVSPAPPAPPPNPRGPINTTETLKPQPHPDKPPREQY